MSLEKFITDMLNIKSENIEKLETILHSDNSISIKIKLVPNENTICPYCSGKVSILGYSPENYFIQP